MIVMIKCFFAWNASSVAKRVLGDRMKIFVLNKNIEKAVIHCRHD
jgi:hypothetical protein